MKDNEDEYINDEIAEKENGDKDLPNTLWGTKKTENEISKITKENIEEKCQLTCYPSLY